MDKQDRITKENVKWLEFRLQRFSYTLKRTLDGYFVFFSNGDNFQFSPCYLHHFKLICSKYVTHNDESVIQLSFQF